jgi:diketogulonate reductase-like aldo/keto reductase
VQQIAEKTGHTMAQVATAWSLSRGVNPILGLQTQSRIDEAVASLGVVLEEEDLKALEKDYSPKAKPPAW